LQNTFNHKKIITMSNRLKIEIGEFLLIIPPDEKVNAEVFSIKKEFDLNYGCSYSANLTPHITLTNFLQFEMMENRIIQQLERFSKSIRPFNIDLKGFGGFPTHSIYVNILRKKPIVEIVKGIRSNFASILNFDEKYKPKFITQPHLTIARGMTTAQYDMAFTEWRDEQFDSGFYADNMTLLKRLPGSNYQTVKKFSFAGQDFRGLQLELPF
jgi:2'-5' RNA ligase